MIGSLRFRLGTLANGETGFSRYLQETKLLEKSHEAVLRQHVRRKLALTLAHATATVPWYRARYPLFDERSEPWDFFSLMASVTKQDLQTDAPLFRSTSYQGRVVRKVTGGSTGQPIVVYKDPRAVSYERAASWSFYSSYGLQIGSKCIRFWGTPTSASRSLRSPLADFAANRTTLTAFGLGSNELRAHWLRCVRLQAPFWYGYASMLGALAEFVDASGEDGRSAGARVIVSTSEVLLPHIRQSLSRVFGALVRDEYGCGEFGPIAYECEAGLMHVVENNVLVEIVKHDGSKALPGESGQLLVTDLNNRAMPLIRFSIGDLGEVGGSCSCGRSSATLKRIWGREYDFLVDADGRKYHGEFIMYLFEDLASKGVTINQFQVIQDSSGALEVRLVGDVHSDRESLDIVCSELRSRLPNLPVAGKLVSSIEKRPSGKTPLIIRRG